MYFFGFSPSYVFKCVSSNRLYTRRQNHTDCIYLTFPPVCYQMRPQNCFIWGYIIMRCRDFIQWSQYSVCRVDDWNKNNREYGVFTMRWNLPSGYIITLAALYVYSALGLIFALRSNCNQFKYTPQVTGTEKAAVAAITSFHCHNWHLGVYCSVVLATYGAKNMKGGLGWGDFNMINRSQISKKGLFRRRNLFLRVWKSDTKLLGKWEN